MKTDEYNNNDNNIDNTDKKNNNVDYKINFFVRVKNAIFKLENYESFILEKNKIAVSYFFKLVLLVAIITALVSTYNFSIMVKKGFSYVQNDLPEFSYSDGILKFNEDKEAYDEDLDFYTVLSTKSTISDSSLKELENKAKNHKVSLIFLQDKVIFSEYGANLQYRYEDLQEDYKINVSNKSELINALNSVGAVGINITYFIISFFTMYIVNAFSIIEDILLVFLFGLITSRICGVMIHYSKVLVLALYSLTLSIILSSIYSVVYGITGFYIEYFNLMYLMVAYVYLVAAILIIKSDLIKQNIELQEIAKIQKQVKEEIEEKEQEENEKNRDIPNEEDESVDNNTDSDDTDNNIDNKDNKSDGDKKRGNKSKENDDGPIINREPDGSEI